jgi:hypothetical protein
MNHRLPPDCAQCAGEYGHFNSYPVHKLTVAQIFLLFKTLDRSRWLPKLEDSRARYDSLRFRYLRAIEHPDEFDTSVDPLSENEEVLLPSHKRRYDMLTSTKP